MVERPLCMREVPGSIPGFSISFPYCLFFLKNKFSRFLTKLRSETSSIKPHFLSQHLFFKSKGPKADSGGTFIQLNQPSYRESLRPTGCVKPRFGLVLV